MAESKKHMMQPRQILASGCTAKTTVNRWRTLSRSNTSKQNRIGWDEMTGDRIDQKIPDMSQVIMASVISLRWYFSSSSHVCACDCVCVLLDNEVKNIFLGFGLWSKFESHLGQALLLLHVLIP